VEIYNGRDKRDYSAQTQAEFAQPYRLATLANSDAHLYWEIGRACTEVDLDRPDADVLRAAILARRCRPVRRAEQRSTVAVYTSKVVKRARRVLA
jgi:hypothetical protein